MFGFGFGFNYCVRQRWLIQHRGYKNNAYVHFKNYMIFQLSKCFKKTTPLPKQLSFLTTTYCGGNISTYL